MFRRATTTKGTPMAKTRDRKFHRRKSGHWVSDEVRNWQARHAVAFNIGEEAMHFPMLMLPTDNSEPRHAWKRTGADVGSKRNTHA